MRTLSLDLRTRIVEAYQRGEGSYRSLARRFSVSRASVERLMARYHSTGSAAAKTYRHGPKPRVDEADFDLIAAWIEAEPDLTQAELARRFTEATGREAGRRTMGRALRRMGQSRKKADAGC